MDEWMDGWMDGRHSENRDWPNGGFGGRRAESGGEVR